MSDITPKRLQFCSSDPCQSLNATITHRMENRFEDLKEMYYTKMFKESSNLVKSKKSVLG